MIVGKNNEMPQARNLCTCSGHSYLFRIRPSTIILTNAIIMHLDWFFYQTKIARWISSLWMCMSTNSENNSPGNPFCPNPDDWNCFLLKWISVWVIVFQSILLGRKVTDNLTTRKPMALPGISPSCPRLNASGKIMTLYYSVLSVQVTSLMEARVRRFSQETWVILYSPCTIDCIQKIGICTQCHSTLAWAVSPPQAGKF